MINLFNTECIAFMKTKKDNEYHLAITDPPYGIGAGFGVGWDKLAKVKRYKNGEWDNAIPTKEYFSELKRVSKNQIIWGGNYFIEYLNNTSCFIVWDKLNGNNNFADCELAWTSFKTAVRKFEFMWHGMLQGNMKDKQDRIHPTEKPYELYRWLLKNYAKPGDKILDTHGGSMSIAIACHDMGFDLDLCELDKDYFEAGKKRYENHIQQIRMF